jgi:3-phytase
MKYDLGVTSLSKTGKKILATIACLMASTIFILAFIWLQAVNPRGKTSSVVSDADDCAIWIHPTDATKSVVIGTDKGRGGGLYVWNLRGEKLQFIPLVETNNVDVRNAMRVGGEMIDIAVVNLQRTKELKVYKIDPTNSRLVDITTHDGIKTPELDEPYGLCLYRRPNDGAIFAIASSKLGNNGNLQQYRLQDDGRGKVKGEHVRTFGNNSIRDKVEGLVADDELGYVYAADETKAVRKYYADPDLNKNEQIVAFATRDGFKGDREGIGIYKCDDGTGYILISSQDNKSVKIYHREGEKEDPHRHNLLATVVTNGAKNTDGLEVTSQSAGPTFPKGFLVKHNSKSRNFVLYAWEDIAGNELKICAGEVPGSSR